MAERRMFTAKIVESDDFTEMPFSAQCLYFHLNMNADDDGFLNNAQKIRKSIEASQSDLDLLIEKRFILSFGGVIVIKHWRMNNQIRKDRYKPTQYTELFQKLKIKDDGSYTENLDDIPDNQTATTWQPNGNHLATQYSLGQVSVVQDSIGQESIDKPVRHKYGEYKNVLLSDEDLEKLQTEFPYDYEERIEKLSSYIESTGKTYKNHLATIRNWARNEKPKETAKPKAAASGNPFLDLLNEGD